MCGGPVTRLMPALWAEDGDPDIDLAMGDRFILFFFGRVGSGLPEIPRCACHGQTADHKSNSTITLPPAIPTLENTMGKLSWMDYLI